MTTLALTNGERYKYINSTKITGRATPTVHIDNRVYTRVEWLLDQFLSERANIDFLRDFHCLVPMPGGRELSVQIDSMSVYWQKCDAEDGSWYEPTEIVPIWTETYLYDEDGERLPHDFDIHIVLRRLTFH